MSKPHIIATFHKYYHGDYWTFEVISGPKLCLSPHSWDHHYHPSMPGREGYEACLYKNRLYIQKKTFQNEQQKTNA